MKPAIFATYHGDLLIGIFELPRSMPGLDVLISRSGDGEVISRFVKLFKLETIRGGSSSGSVGALLQMRKCMEQGRAVVVSIDGPRGPAGIVKSGVITVASQTGAPVIPVAIRADRAWQFRSWDRMMLCKPGANVRVVYGEPFYVAPNVLREGIEAARLQLERQMRIQHTEPHPGSRCGGLG